MTNNSEVSFGVLLTPKTMGEAVIDYLRKEEVIGPNTKVLKMNIPVTVDEDGDVPISITVSS